MTFTDTVKNIFSRSPRSAPRPIANEDVAGRQGGLDDLKILARYDTIFIIDDSGSMAGERWAAAKTALGELVELVKDHDANGIDIHFLNAVNCNGVGLRTQAEVDQLFSTVMPDGRTPTGERLKVLITPYIESLPKKKEGYLDSAIKPRNYIVITDGVATDTGNNRLKPVILKLMKKLDDHKAPANQLGIQFVQVGKEDTAAAFLNELDDDLAGSRTRDIVDTFPYGKLNGDIDASHLVKMLLGSIAKRIDNYNRL